MAKSKRSRRAGKSASERKLFRPEKPVGFRPGKPDEVFPLTPLGNGAWAKKVDGKLKYFGSWGTKVDGQYVQKPGDEWWKPALDLYEGRAIRVKSGDNVTVKDLCNHFLTAKLQLLESKELSQRSFDEYKGTTDLLCDKFGRERLIDELTCDDFGALRAEMAKRWGVVRLGNSIVRVKTIFIFAFARRLSKIDPKQRYGDSFKRPAAKVMRENRYKNGGRMLEPAAIRALIDAAPVPLKAMILLGVNIGFGNHDVATLPFVSNEEKVLDLDGGWITYPRPKTAVRRRAALWPETVEALRQAIAERPEVRQPGAEPFVFITSRGRQWLSNGVAFPVVAAIGALMKSVGVHRAGCGFYSLRHAFRTAASATKDETAVNYVMGHSDGTMGENYTHGIDDARLLAVSRCVHDWLFGTPPAATPDDEAEAPAPQRKAQAKPVEPASGDRPALRLFIA